MPSKKMANKSNMSTRKSKKSKKVRIVLKKGGLTLHNEKGEPTKRMYHIREPLEKRRALLRALVRQRKGNALGIYRALLARRTLGKHTLTPAYKDILTEDAAYMKRKYYDTPQWKK